MIKNVAFYIILTVLLGCNSKKTETSEADTNSIEKASNADLITFKKLKFYKVSGEAVQLAPDKLSFINLWATWCIPCIKEMPSLEKLMAKSEEQMDFYFASYEEAEKVKKFMDKTEVDLPFYTYNDMEIPDTLDTQLLPFTVIVKGEEVLFSKTGSSVWHEGEVFDEIKTILEGQ